MKGGKKYWNTVEHNDLLLKYKPFLYYILKYEVSLININGVTMFFPIVNAKGKIGRAKGKKKKTVNCQIQKFD